MQFFEIQKPLKRVGTDKYIIGQDAMAPQLTLDGSNLQVKNVEATDGLFISGLNFIEFLTGDYSFLQNIENNYTKSRHGLGEAFEKDENGDLTPSNSPHISDTMWILRNENDLELRSNHWRYNSGPEAFTEDISI
jgi:hypothetical protein|tara:strand:- start:3791 stop:4195 length:405 start_codon:yes stop_codon:yes gene_type:complete